MIDTIEAHKYSINNMTMLKNDSVCGCFYCGQIFSPKLITETIEDQEETACCPYCGIDSVIGASSGYPITQEFLEEMNFFWFGSDQTAVKDPQ